jgi:hypothetical protein
MVIGLTIGHFLTDSAKRMTNAQNIDLVTGRVRASDTGPLATSGHHTDPPAQLPESGLSVADLIRVASRFRTTRVVSAMDD